MELPKYRESLGVDAIAAIPPIYFHLPEYAIEKYLERYQRSGARNSRVCHLQYPAACRRSADHEPVAEMRKNPRVIGVKNSSMP